ncbi:AMMECR1 domain-containing protein [Candidatus Fermentibacteria bacterium]|nr:MAG: AMMECR1 domain-containing protein [Candidatus Fermentibacteria bacterium]
MTAEEKKSVLALARSAVEAAARGEPPPEIPDEEILRKENGAFVTLKSKGRLRGCIGHFTGLGSLGKTILAMAGEAALHDSRFIPVNPEELPGLTIEVSVLSSMKRCLAEQVEPGIHGLYVRQGFRAGTLLPQVAAEEGWNREQFLSHTCIKAGLPPEAWRNKETEISVYTAEVITEEKERK